MLENKVPIDKWDIVETKLMPGWKFLNNSKLVNTGRTLVFYDPNVMKVVVLNESNQHMHPWVERVCHSFFTTVMYASNDEVERKQLWEQLGKTSTN